MQEQILAAQTHVLTTGVVFAITTNSLVYVRQRIPVIYAKVSDADAVNKVNLGLDQVFPTKIHRGPHTHQPGHKAGRMK